MHPSPVSTSRTFYQFTKKPGVIRSNSLIPPAPGNPPVYFLSSWTCLFWRLHVNRLIEHRPLDLAPRTSVLPQVSRVCSYTRSCYVLPILLRYLCNELSRSDVHTAAFGLGFLWVPDADFTFLNSGRNTPREMFLPNPVSHTHCSRRL